MSKPRKPPDIATAQISDVVFPDGSKTTKIEVEPGLLLNPKDARKLAAWLIKAADYLEAKK